MQAHHLVGVLAHAGRRALGGDRDGEHHPSGSLRAGDLAGRPGGRPGGDPVINDHHGPAAQRKPGLATAEQPGPPLHLGPFPGSDLGDLLLADSAPLDDVPVEHHYAVLTDRAECQFRLVGDAELTHDDDIEGCAQGLGDLGGHRHPAAGQPHHDDVLTAQVGQLIRESASRLAAVGEEHAAPSFSPTLVGDGSDPAVVAVVTAVDDLAAAGRAADEDQVPAAREGQPLGGFRHPE